MDICRFQVDTLKVEIHSDKKSCGQAAAEAAAEALSELSRNCNTIGVLFATGASQLDTLHALLRRDDVPWERILGFHLDEYVGIEANHPASFRGYLRRNLTSRVVMRDFTEIDGNAADLGGFCRSYTAKLRKADPQLCLLGIGENGHLAFNDPGEADFHDPQEMKVVELDKACRQQQVAEGWFGTLEEVPERALTLTIPTIFRIPKLILTVPGDRKAQIVKRALQEPISEDCPATILRTHPDAKLFLDAESAAELDLKNLALTADVAASE
jgi:glucosamine-6-phosphate deaminase